jgi:hypothetical protein
VDILDPLFVAGLLPGLLVALSQHGPGFRTGTFLTCWSAADALCASLVALAAR